MGYRETLYNENQSLATEDMMQSPTMDQAMAKSASEPTIQTYAPGSPGKGGATASTVSLRSLDSRPVFTRPSETDVLGRPRLKPIRVRLAQRSRMKDGANAARCLYCPANHYAPANSTRCTSLIKCLGRPGALTSPV